MEFSEKLKKHRKELGLSQEDLSFQLNVSRQAVSKWETGQGFPETEKLLLMSDLFGVSLDSLLKDDPSISLEKKEQGYYASKETVEGFLTAKALRAQKIGMAVSIMIFAASFPIFFDNGIGSALFLCAVALGVGILILNGLSINRYREIETQPLIFDPIFYKNFKESSNSRRKQQGIKIASGVAMIIFSVVCVVLIEDVFFIEAEQATAIIPVTVSFAVYLFITAGSALESEKVITENDEHLKESASSERNSGIYGTIMPLAAMIFLALGFKHGIWHPGWIVFPTAAILCNFIIAIRNKQ